MNRIWHLIDMVDMIYETTKQLTNQSTKQASTIATLQ